MRRPAVLIVLVSVASACGPSIPGHAGYRASDRKPWTKAKVLELDDSQEAEVDDIVQYAKRQRARWYAVDLPEFGELEVKLTSSPLALSDSKDKEVDLAFEVLDERYTVLIRADADEEDAGDESKTRTLYELEAGRYYLHVYLQRRLDAAEFSLQVAFTSAKKEFESTFPTRVAYTPVLPAVSPIDDAPVAAAPPPRKPCKGDRCKKPPKPPPPETAVRARIAGISASGSGTRLKINKGANAGIKAGWKGSVITQSGASVEGGSFTVDKVTETESFASVRATPDSVTSAKYVRLRPP